MSLLCRENISAETLWDGGWLLRQLLPYSEAEFNRKHLKILNVCFFILFDSVSVFLPLSSLLANSSADIIRIHMRNAKMH